jgi:hypothetical protein
VEATEANEEEARIARQGEKDGPTRSGAGIVIETGKGKGTEIGGMGGTGMTVRGFTAGTIGEGTGHDLGVGARAGGTEKATGMIVGGKMVVTGDKGMNASESVTGIGTGVGMTDCGDCVYQLYAWSRALQEEKSAMMIAWQPVLARTPCRSILLYSVRSNKAMISEWIMRGRNGDLPRWQRIGPG